MYFSNVDQVLREVHRVCKPGGRVAFMAWGTRRSRSSRAPSRMSDEAEAALSAYARDGGVHLPARINVASGRA